MAKTSDVAKQIIINDLSKIYPNGKLIDKKFYTNILADGENVQICISLTAPKTPIDLGLDIDFTENKPKITTDEQEKIEKEVDAIFDFFKL